jgi:LuxR family maltose regulon positive regulatory protein
MLRDQLEARTTPREIAALDLRASAWFEGEGLIEEALKHALAAEDVDRAARLVEDNRVDLLDNDQWYVLEEWLRLLPPEMREERPELLLADAWSAYERFQFDRLAAILEKVKAHLVPDGPAPPWSGELHLLLGEIQYWSGESGSARRTFEAAREELPRKHGLVRGLLELQYGLALLMDGERERAIESLEERIREKGTEEGIYLSRLVAGLYFVHYLSGNLVGARAEGRRWHAVASRSGIAYTDAWSSYVRACGSLQAGDLAGAHRHFADAAEHRYILHARAAVDSLAGLALTQQLTDCSDAAAESLDLLYQFALELADSQYLSVAQSSRARLALLRGESEQAIEWARSVREEPYPAGLFMFLEVPWITQARALIAEGTEESLAAALELLATIRCQSEGCRFTNQTIEVTVLQTLALKKQGRSGEALDTLHEVLVMAEPGGWIRPFVEAGPPMVELMRTLSTEHAAAAFVEKILSATGRPEAGPTRVKRPPLDLLTDREAEILELLPQRLQNKEIATRLFISPQTVNSHLKNVYQKLGVNNRRQAVMRAAELGLLSLD